MQGIICFPLGSVLAESDSTSTFRKTALSGWPASWVENGSGIIRQLRWLGNRNFSLASVDHLDFMPIPFKISKSATVKKIIRVRRNGAFHYALFFLEMSDGANEFDRLRRPGVEGTRKLFESIVGYEIDYSELVFATSVIELGKGTKAASAKDGLLVIPAGYGDYYFEITYGLLMSAIAAERQLLELASQASFNPGVFGIRARKANGLIDDWFTTPSSDSTRILNEFRLLRDSLSLDTRHKEVKNALSRHVRAWNLAAASFVATIGVTSPILGIFFDVTNKVPIAGFWVAMTVLAISSLVSLIVWGITRKV